MTTTPQIHDSTGLLNAALAYAQRLGWAIVLLSPRSKVPIIPKAEGGNGFLDATTDDSIIRAWWTRWPQANVGIATGQRSGIAVLDIDPRHGGDAALAALVAKHGEIPDTPTVLTNADGQHLYFSIAVRAPTHDLADGGGLILKADSGYVVAPPSIHPNGCVYVRDVLWKPVRRPLAPLPGWLLGHSQHKGLAPPLPEIITDGNRNRLLASLAGSMRRRRASEGAILAALMEENGRCEPPLPEHELSSIAHSVARYAPAEAPARPYRPSWRTQKYTPVPPLSELLP